MTNYVQIPPDSTGKKVSGSLRYEIELSSESIPLSPCDCVVGTTSGATGTVTGIARECVIEVYMKCVTGTFQAGESIQVGGCTYGVICACSTPHEIFVQHTSAVDRDNPERAHKISERGAAYMRFDEGVLQFDAFGRAMISESEPALSGSYVGRDSPAKYCDVTATCGTIVHLPNESMMRLQTTTSSGSQASRTTLKYINYQPGGGSHATMALLLGDSGKTNLTRRWGIFDDDNGLFFNCVNGTVGVGLRTNTTGSAVDTIIPQACWNGTNVSGTGDSIFTYDKTKGNLYWIDYEWQGVGRVRFGLYAPNGERIVVHTIENANANTTVYMRNPTLPLRWEQVNTGVTSGTSDMKISSYGVFNDGKFIGAADSIVYDALGAICVPNACGQVPLASFRPKLTLSCCIANRTQYKINNINTDKDAGMVKIRFIANACITGGTWGDVCTTFSSAEVNTTATVSGGKVIYSYFVNGTQLNFNERDLDTRDSFGVYPNGTDRSTVTVTAERLDAGTSKVGLTMEWDEMK